MSAYTAGAPKLRRRKRGKPWPISRITPEQMHLLWLLGQRDDVPITRLVEMAICRYLADRMDEEAVAGEVRLRVAEG